MSFHVPEKQRDINHPILRTTVAYGNNGMFRLDSPEPGWRLAIICSDSSDPHLEEHLKGWEHVSVHAYKGPEKACKTKMRTPTWKEMVFIKNLCWDENDVVMQLHPAKSEYINCHPHVLHLWRPIDKQIPTPPSILVGPAL